MCPDSLESPECCRYCFERPDRRCPVCAQRQRKAWRLHEQGLDSGEITMVVRISERRVEALLESERIGREIDALRCDRVPVGRLAACVERWRDRDPEHNTWPELAPRAGYRCPHAAQRLLGDLVGSSYFQDGVHHPGRRATTVDVDAAGRLVRAMGYLPAEFDWL